jgi:hypothetical protein
MSIYVPEYTGSENPFRMGLHKFGFGGLMNSGFFDVGYSTSALAGTSILFCSHFTFPFRCYVKDFMIAVTNVSIGSDTRVRFAVYEADDNGLPTTMIASSLNTIGLTSAFQFGSFSTGLGTSFVIDRPRRVIVGLQLPYNGFTGGNFRGAPQVYPGYPNATNTDYYVSITGLSFTTFPITITGISTSSVTKVNSTSEANLRLCNLIFGFGVEEF